MTFLPQYTEIFTLGCPTADYVCEREVQFIEKGGLSEKVLKVIPSLFISFTKVHKLRIFLTIVFIISWIKEILRYKIFY